MPVPMNLEDQIFGKLIVVDQAPQGKNGREWNCLCECGNWCVVRTNVLRRGSKTHCGCEPRKGTLDLTGKKFGMLTVLDRATPIRQGGMLRTRWNCECDCGNMAIVRTESLRIGNTRSCGCLVGKCRGKKGVIEGNSSS